MLNSENPSVPAAPPSSEMSHAAAAAAGTVLPAVPEPPTLADYVAELARRGAQVLPGSGGSYWVSYFESRTIIRFPKFLTDPVERQEARRALKKTRSAMLNFILDPDERHPANAWLYICTDQDYALEKLSSPMRRDVRRGLREFVIGPISAEQAVTFGVEAYCETRKRNGLSDGVPEILLERYRPSVRMPGQVFFGAWRGDQLAALVDVTQVDDWAEIEGSFSRHEFMRWNPNDALLFYVLEHYLRQRRCRAVSIGLSSVESTGKEAGLHAFKLKVGFRAQPVHREFVVHPLLRPLANGLFLACLRGAMKLLPRYRPLRKAEGVLAAMLGKRSSIVEPHENDN